MKTLGTLAATVGVVAVIAVAGPYSSAGAVVASPFGSSVGSIADAACIERGDDGVQVWDGEASAALDVLGNKLQEVADDYQDEVAGVAYCSHYEGAVVFVADPSDRLMGELSRVSDETSGLTVNTQEVEAGLTELLALSSDLAVELDTDAVTSIGPDMYSGGLRIGVSDESRVRAGVTSVEQLVRGHAGRNLPIAASVRGAGDFLVTRAADSAPYWMGGRITSQQNGLGEGCSSGIPIFVNGAKRLLTAGHCTSSSWYNNGNLVGSTYTTTFPGNADIYGDWKLLQGSSYDRRVFSGDVNETTSLPITGAAWGGRPNGSSICTSGMAAGQICRYYVLGSYQLSTAEGVSTNHNLELRHDSTGGSNYDNKGALDGDSGGPCYYADGKGGVIVVGVVSAHDSFFGTYTCAQLSGVRAWNSGATLG